MRNFAGGVVALALMATLTGCNNSSDTAEPGLSASSSPEASATTAATTPTRPTLTADSLQPPSQDNKYTEASGRPKVVYDPCTWIPDEVISKAGYAPSSRERGKDQIAEQTFLTCNFDSDQRSLQVDSGNVTWDEDLQKYQQAQQLEINGRPALWTNDRTFRDTCEIHLRTKVGFVRIAASLTDAVSVNDVSPCDGLQDTAAAIEPTIGPDA